MEIKSSFWSCWRNVVHADIFARFLRDRIGKENVIFISGTDCYGSPILESYRKLKENGYEKTIEDYVKSNHLSQKKTLEDYNISLNIFGASALGEQQNFIMRFRKRYLILYLTMVI